MLKIIVEVALAFLITSITTCSSVPALAANETKDAGKPQMQFFSAGDVVFINELGAVIMLRDKAIVVDMVNPPDQRSKEYQSVDLKKDDIVIMVNGKKAAALADIKAAYESASVGQEVKLGIRRGKEMMIAAFPKADKSKMAQQQVVAFDTEGGTEVVHGDGSKKVMKFGAGDGNITIVSELDLLLNEADSKVAIASVMNTENPLIKNAGIAPGDVLTAIETTKVAKLKDFVDAYEKLKVGDEYSVSFLHDGKTVTVKAKKAAEDNSPKMIRTIKQN